MPAAARSPIVVQARIIDRMFAQAPTPVLRRALGLVALLATLACTPALDWRQVRPDAAGIEALFPCKPDSHARQVPLAEQSVRMTMYACTAQGHTYALTHADLGDPARVRPALGALRAAAAANLQGTETLDRDLNVPGMTPHPEARRLDVSGRLPDGTPVKQQMVILARGTVVYQLSRVGPPATQGADADTEAAETFLGSIRLP